MAKAPRGNFAGACQALQAAIQDLTSVMGRRGKMGSGQRFKEASRGAGDLNTALVKLGAGFISLKYTIGQVWFAARQLLFVNERLQGMAHRLVGVMQVWSTALLSVTSAAIALLQPLKEIPPELVATALALSAILAVVIGAVAAIKLLVAGIGGGALVALLAAVGLAFAVLPSYFREVSKEAQITAARFKDLVSVWKDAQLFFGNLPVGGRSKPVPQDDAGWYTKAFGPGSVGSALSRQGSGPLPMTWY